MRSPYITVHNTKGNGKMFYCCGVTDKGSVREKNEDAFLINKKVVTNGKAEARLSAPLFCAVADGVGGEASGEVASKMALGLLSDIKPAAGYDYEKKIIAAHNALKKYGVSHKTENMQTTLCALAVDSGGNAVMINAGDSRMYLYRGEKIKQLSKDQSLVQMLYEKGYIAEEQKLHHSRKNVIFPVLGSLADEPQPSIEPINGGLKHGDIILICSDGLSDNLTSGDMEDILAQPKKLPARAADLVERAVSGGSKDNVTALVVAYLDEPISKRNSK